MIATTFFTAVDWTVLAAYVAVIVGVGYLFWKRNRSAEDFTAGGRSLPGWLCGMSIFATYLSSISYFALPGKAFLGNWNAFVFSIAIPPAAWVAVRYFLPMYRSSNEVSAYSLLETRFGLWARLFASAFYLVFHIARVGVILYLMGLPMAILFGWDIRWLILVTGAIVTAYALFGGVVAVIWADAIQAFILLGGALIALAILLTGMPDGPGQVISMASDRGKLSLGSMDPLELAQPTVWVVLAYSVFENLKNFGIDQSYVQRYIASKSDTEAAKSIWLGALLYVPVSAMFLFIGTALFAYYETHAGSIEGVRRVVAEQKLMQSGIDAASPDYELKLAETASTLQREDIGDRVFPHFIASQLPSGIRGLLIAAVFAAAMSTVSTSLNSSATLILSDFYQRLLNPNPSTTQSMRVLRSATAVWGLLGTMTAIVLAQVASTALDTWWTLSGVLGAAIIGLFLMGMTSKASARTAMVCLTIGGLVIAWMTLSASDAWPQSLAQLASPMHAYLIIVVGPCLMMLLAKVIPSKQSDSIR
ncbi:MAG: sodium:solute symporter [Planctomycetota bacterium]